MPSPRESPASPQYGTTPFTTFSRWQRSTQTPLFMLLVVLLLVSKAGAVCVGGPQELRMDEVLVMCPLSEDVRLTKRDVVISHFSNHDHPNPDTMLGCVWPKRDAHNPDCRSRFHFTLTSLQKDCVMARVSRAQLHKDGFYQCELVPPPDEDHAFSRCLVFDNDDTEDPSTTISPVIPSTADELRHPRNDTEKVSTSADGGYQRGNSDVALSVSVVILILIIFGFFALIFYIFWRCGSATCKPGRSRERPIQEELTGEQPKQEEPEPTNLIETKVLLKMGQDKC